MSHLEVLATEDVRPPRPCTGNQESSAGAGFTASAGDDDDDEGTD